MQLADRGVSHIILDLPADMLLKVAEAGRARGLFLFNASAVDYRLRQEDCRADVIHVAPSRSMLADGLAQYLVWKRWRRWLLVVGSHDPDKLYADAVRRAAGRYGVKIVQERVFQDTGGARRTDSGLVQIQSQIPLFTQSVPDYDVLVAADESQIFASYLPYRTHDARPVAGSAGLVPTSWDASLDQWGAIQLQDRFMRLFSRRMTALDMQAWTAVRMIGEAAARVNSADPKSLFDYVKGPDFAVAAFKGRKLTVRDWASASSAHSSYRRTRDRLGIATGGVPAPIFRTRYPRHGSSGDQMSAQIAFLGRRAMWLRLTLGVWFSTVIAGEASTFTAYVSNEKGNTVSVIDTNEWEVVKTIKVGQRPRGIAYTKDQKYVLVAVGDDDTIQMIDTVAGMTPRFAARQAMGPL
jgi:ABC transporter substrate binding protein (PQQ-dependent alcohol dehydrogenase system)